LLDRALPPENVVEVLVGEAFDRLDAVARLVMQALAVYAAPVPVVAIDFLLQPYEPAINSGPILGRLVNAQLARRDQGRYHLHPVDRSFALGRIPDDATENHELEFTQVALLHRAADYFAQTRTPRDTWRSLDDLAAQLAEFELRCQAADYDTAAEILSDIDFDCLFRWGHYRFLIELRRHLDGYVSDPWHRLAHIASLGNCYQAMGGYQAAMRHHREALVIAREIGDRGGEGNCLGNIGSCYQATGDYQAAMRNHGEALGIAREIGDRGGEGVCLGNLGVCHASLGDFRAAIDHYREALDIDRAVGNRQGEGADLGNLGNCYASQGDYRAAMRHHGEALDIDREIGDRKGEGADLGNLGVCHSSLGDFRAAMEHHEEALGIARDIGDRRAEGIHLGNLGTCHLSLGDYRAAMEHHEEALGIARDIGDRYQEANELGFLADTLRCQRDWLEVTRYYEEAIAVADATRNVESQAEPRCGLAETRLLSGDPEGALIVVRQLTALDYPPRRAFVHLVEGLAHHGMGNSDLARPALTAAICAADARLAPGSLELAALEVKGIAQSALALLGEETQLSEAIDTFQSARGIVTCTGVVEQLVALLDLLGPSDHDGLLDRIRDAASGR